MTPFSLSDIKGLGSKTVDSLISAGIDSVEKLANIELEKLLEVDGIGETSGKRFIERAKDLLKEEESEASEASEGSVKETEEIEKEPSIDLDEEKIKEELKKAEEKKKRLEGKLVEKGDFLLVKITGKTQKGFVFRVSSVEDAKKAGIFEEEKAKQGYYTPEFIVVGKPGFVNEGLTETIEELKYFEKKSVRVPPNKAFGKRDPQKIERIGIAKFKKMNEGKNPQLGQDFTKKGTGQRGVVKNVTQGKVLIDYNHPLAGQSLDYNVEIVDKIESFNEKIEYFILSKGIPKENISEFEINHVESDKLLEITIPKMFLFQNLTYFKFGLAMDLQTHMTEEIDNVKFIEIFEKIASPTPPDESVMKKVEEYNKEQQEAEKIQETETSPQTKENKSEKPT